jgi:hypothetical protein
MKFAVTSRDFEPPALNGALKPGGAKRYLCPMTDANSGNSPSGAENARAKRLRAALRENLKRRKLQARGRSSNNPNQSNSQPAHDSAGFFPDKAKD